MDSNVKKLTKKISELQRTDGLKAINVYANGERGTTQEQIAGGILDLIESETVADPDTF